MKQMKRVISMLLAVVMIFTACPISAFATTTNITEEGGEIVASSYNDYLYTVLSDGTISICGYTGSPESDKEGTYLEIPSTIDGVAVTQIAEEAFAYNDVIDTVVIPESITSVGNSAFYHCSDLKTIVFLGTAPTFGFTVAEGSHALAKVFTLESSDISIFCSLLVNDLGEEGAKGVEIAEYEDLDSLKKAYSDYINALDACLQNESSENETVTTEIEEEIQATTTPVETENVNSVSDNDAISIISDDTVSEETTTTVEVLAEGTCGDSLTWVGEIPTFGFLRKSQL